MNVFKRFSTTVSHSIESAVARMENHDAVADAALARMRRATAEAKVRLTRVNRDREQAHKRHAELVAQADKWTQRARETGAADESRALECVRRMNECRAKAAAAADTVSALDEQHARLAGAVEAMETRLQALSRERNVLRTRASVTDAQRNLSRLGLDEDGPIEEVFARWEASVAADEYLQPCAGDGAPADLIEAQFEREEQAEQLRAQLDELLGDVPEGKS